MEGVLFEHSHSFLLIHVVGVDRVPSIVIRSLLLHRFRLADQPDRAAGASEFETLRRAGANWTALRVPVAAASACP